jgi:hypothetical protein
MSALVIVPRPPSTVQSRPLGWDWTVTSKAVPVRTLLANWKVAEPGGSVSGGCPSVANTSPYAVRPEVVPPSR